MAAGRRANAAVGLVAFVLAFQLSSQQSGAEGIPQTPAQQQDGSSANTHILSDSDRPANSPVSLQGSQGVRSLLGTAPANTPITDTAHAADSSGNTPTALVQPLSCSAAQHVQLDSISIEHSAASADAITTLPTRATCSQRPPFRLFIPAAVQSSQSYIWLVLQLVNPSVAVQLWQLFTAATCGAASIPCITAAPPAAVVQSSLETSETDGIARIQVSMPSSNSGLVGQTLTLVLQADPCNPVGTAANFTVDVITGVPQGTLRMASSPSLTNSSFKVVADFNHNIASFNLSRLLAGNVSSISTIAWTADDSFVIYGDGTAGSTVKLQMQAGSFQDTTYTTSTNDTNSVTAHIPALQEIMPAFSTAAQRILPYALGLSGIACSVAVAAIPGTPLAICAPPLIRTMGHLQIFAASIGISRTPYAGGFPDIYAAAVAEISWALLDWFPVQPLQALKKNWLQSLAIYTQPVDITWSANPPDGSKLDSWLLDIQNTSAVFNSYDISSDITQQQQLQQLQLATRATAPQLPIVINLTPNTLGLALTTWSGLASAGQVTVTLLVLAFAIHAVVASTTSSWAAAAGSKDNSGTYKQSVSVQFPLLVLGVMLLTLPALLYWVGCLAAAKQQFWMVFAGIFSVGTVAGALYIWVLQHILGTTQTALLGGAIGASAAAAAAATRSGVVQLLRLDGVYDRSGLIRAAKQLFQMQQQQQTPVVSLVQQQQQQQQNLGDAVAVVGVVDGQKQSSQRTTRQQQQQKGGVPLGEAAATPAAAAAVDDHLAAAVSSPADNYGSSSSGGGGGLIEAVTNTLYGYQQRLQHCRTSAMLSVSGKSGSFQQQQQQPVQEVQDLAVGKQRGDDPYGQQQQCRQQQDPSTVSQAADRRSGSSSASSSDGDASGRAVGEARERLLPNSTVDEDVERLQQEEVLRELREARRRAKVRKQLRQQRLRPDSLIEPRPLPPDPPELTDYGRSPPGMVGSAGATEEDYTYVSAVAAADGIDPRQVAAMAAKAQNPYDSWQLQQAQGGRLPSNPGSRAAAAAGAAASGGRNPAAATNGGRNPAAAAAVAGSRNSEAAAVVVEHEGWFPRFLASVGLLHSALGLSQTGNPLVQQRLQYMARYGVLLWDITGPLGMTDPESEAKLLAGVNQNRLLVANVLFACLAGACCILYGSIGPLSSFEPQIWAITLNQMAWLVYVGGFNPFSEPIITATEGLISTGHILIVVCALWGVVQGENSTLRLVALCSMSGMVFFMAVVECIRAFMLVVSIWYALKGGNRRRRRGAPVM